MKNSFIGRLLISALAVIVTSYILPGVYLSGFFSAIIVALVLSFLNTIVKPILVVLTIPVTILTLGLFLLVINAILIMLAGSIVPGFEVSGFGTALLFSLILSFINYLLGSENL
ncbi:MAG: phage holin family protein [Bacteroidales bacterium]|nr:phage holin family protein [Bacteroidales bacterium]